MDVVVQQEGPFIRHDLLDVALLTPQQNSVRHQEPVLNSGQLIKLGQQIPAQLLVLKDAFVFELLGVEEQTEDDEGVYLGTDQEVVVAVVTETVQVVVVQAQHLADAVQVEHQFGPGVLRNYDSGPHPPQAYLGVSCNYGCHFQSGTQTKMSSIDSIDQCILLVCQTSRKGSII